MANAVRDENRTTAIIAVSSLDGSSPVRVRANPVTGALLSETEATGGNFLIYVDDVDSATSYIGSAAIGSATSAAVWQIKKVATSGTVTIISWAGGTDAFTNVWNNRTSLSYS